MIVGRCDLDHVRTHQIETVRSLPGVNDVESWSHLRFVKESYASAGLGA